MFLSLESEENIEETPQDMLEPEELETFKEIAWDFERDCPIISNGDFVIAEGAEAVKVWAYNALRTDRYRYIALETVAGNELMSIVGKSISKEAKESEIKRMVEESLLINPHILNITNFNIELDEDVLKVSLKINTRYGEVEVNV